MLFTPDFSGVSLEDLIRNWGPAYFTNSEHTASTRCSGKLWLDLPFLDVQTALLQDFYLMLSAAAQAAEAKLCSQLPVNPWSLELHIWEQG